MHVVIHYLLSTRHNSASFSFISFVIENFPLLRTFVLSLNLTLGFESTNPNDYVYKEVILKNAVVPMQECDFAMEYENPGE